MIVGIDASNLRGGGGVTHVTQLLRYASPQTHGVEQVIVWGGSSTLKAIESKPWLTKRTVKALDRNLLHRLYWQMFTLPQLLKAEKCSILFSPGALVSPFCSLPSVVMLQNQLPFEPREARRFGFLTGQRLRFLLLRWGQSRAVHLAKGVIFLSQYSRDVVARAISLKRQREAIIPHGLEARFFCPPRRAVPASQFSHQRPFRLLYVSTVFFYKHQWQVARAVAALRSNGIPIEIDFIGGGHRPAIQLLRKTIHELDPAGKYLHYRGGLPFEQVHQIYQKADAFVFASTCETIAIILLEAMAAGLPIAASNCGPTPEVLGPAAAYFDPESPDDIARAISKLYNDADLRDHLSNLAFTRAKTYSWEKCAESTFSFIAKSLSPSSQS